MPKGIYILLAGIVLWGYVANRNEREHVEQLQQQVVSQCAAIEELSAHVACIRAIKNQQRLETS